MKKLFSVGVIGATGLVGRELIKLLEDFPIKTFSLFASKNSQKKSLFFRQRKISVQVLEKKNIPKNMDILFFAAGAMVSKKFIPEAKKTSSLIIDLSSFFREKKTIPLIIPEINSHLLHSKPSLIASPNCTTTLMLMAIHSLHKRFKIKRIVAATYQAASGGGKRLVEKLKQDTLDYFQNIQKKESYGFNLFLHDSPYNTRKYSEEEVKMAKETCKILEDPKIQVSATCVRVPTIRVHAMTLNVEFQKAFTLKKIYQLLHHSPNLTILEDFSNMQFATALTAAGKKEVFCSRIRRDPTQKNTLELWVVGDQLLKGAALNAYQIAKKWIEL